MKNLFNIPFIIFCLAVSGCAGGAHFRASRIDEASGREVIAGDIKISAPSSGLKTGEHLVYNAQWLGLTVGTVDAHIDDYPSGDGKILYKVSAAVKTAGFMAAIYPVQDSFISYLDKDTLLPVRHEVKRREGRHQIKDYAVEFNRRKNIATYIDFAKGSEREDIGISPDSFDILGALCYLRSRSVKTGDRITLSVNLNKKNYDVEGEMGEVHIIEMAKLGPFDAFSIIPYASLRGEPAGKGRVEAYISAGASRVPIYIVVKGPIFTKVIIRLAHIM
ncbi:MAG: hypothetical protein AUJ75_02295 [Candidatus Omnitrophica bacterium CG1_02_49_10]|nr:MAG: hypothetical protein AUJ75_02295 [Candidatus Omnitrophica bacterium CG1_02_49_10]